MGIAVFRKINARKDRNLVTLYFNTCKLLNFRVPRDKLDILSASENIIHYYTIIHVVSMYHSRKNNC